ncbi:Putative anti-sigma factor [hydrothermal vent metagenome]|uniref:Anti-sigma factor n=1 Tax=hydrothermal vent metagenome TaxID=652676 RepID=A0A3B0U250_9ZZZZ
MERPKDISILLTDKTFQKILSDWHELSEGKKVEVFKEYQVSQEDIEVLHRLWLGLEFKPFKQPEIEVENALNETVWKLAEKNISRVAQKPLRKLFENFARIAAVLILPILTFSIYLYFQNNNPTIINVTPQLVTIHAQPGTKTSFLLPDGSKVWLNAGSELTYPSYFNGKSRDISLSGEAYFEVVKNEKIPMVVSALGVEVKVYGTIFNIYAYPSESYVKTTLVEGSVSLSSSIGKFNGEEEFFIEPGQTVTFFKDTKELTVQNEDTFTHTAWKDGILVFRNNTFAEVLTRLSRRYNVDIELKDLSLSSIHLDAKFRDEDINQVLRLLSYTASFKYYYEKLKKLPDGTYAKSKIYIEKR